MSNSTSSNISNSQIKKSQSWRTLVININSAPGKRAELENLINYTDPDLIIMTETKIDEQVKASEFLPKGDASNTSAKPMVAILLLYNMSGKVVKRSLI